MFQKIVSRVIMVSVLVSMLCFPVMADENIIALLNGEELEFDVPPQLVDDRILVPVRAVAESLNAQVEWDDATQTVVITKEESAAQSDTEQSSESAEPPTSGYFYTSVDGHGSILLAADQSWKIFIPRDYERVLNETGNHIYQKIDENDNLIMMYVQIRDVSKTDLLFQEIAEDAVQDRLNGENGNVNYSIAKEITETTVNCLDYYTFTINMSMIGNSVYYGTCYFTVWDDMLFGFTYMGVDETPGVEFNEVLESFNPLGAQ